MRLKLTVNGIVCNLEVHQDARLVDVLRRNLRLTGTKVGCGEGHCGSCTVLVDGQPVRACVYPARRAAGKQVLTVEGLAACWGDPHELHPLQRAFIDHGVIQCGFDLVDLGGLLRHAYPYRFSIICDMENGAWAMTASFSSVLR